MSSGTFPTEIDKYRLLRKLATGGMAEVYLAQAAGPAGFQKTLVLKRILPHLAEDQAFVEMFLNEARLAALLNHPNIVQIYDLGEAEGSYFIAMEYVDGPNLRDLSRKASEAGRIVPFEQAAKIIALACEGLGYAHDFSENGQALNLIHRDISPDNILISHAGAVKVVDFGIAKAANQASHTHAGALKGKLGYMSPEQLRGRPLDRRADIFSLGVVLYELLAGMKPFDATSDIAAMKAILHDPPIPLGQQRPDCPAALAVIIERALEKDRESRYPDCRAMQRDLEQFLMARRKAVGAYELALLVTGLGEPRPVNAPPEEVPTRIGQSVDHDQTHRMSTLAVKPDARPSSRFPTVALWGGIGVGALIGVGIYLLAFASKTDAIVQPQAAPLPTAQPAPTSDQKRLEEQKRKAEEAEAAEAERKAAEGRAAEERRKADEAQAAEDERLAELEKKQARHGPNKATPSPTRVATEPQVAAVDRPASLVVESDPVCSVQLDGKLVGQTPVEIKSIAPGEHQLLLANREKNLSRSLSVSVSPHEEHREKVKFGSGTIVFRVMPWAFVELDGRKMGQTPIAEAVVYEGEHRVHLSNPELKKDKVVQVQVKPGVRELVKVNFEAE
jgi:serine/threonine-protein kinase